MHAILRPYATAGVVIAGSGLIAATPVMAPAPAVASAVEVALTAGLSDPWQDVYNDASTNTSTLINNYMLAPGIAWQQLYANVMGYTQQFLDDPSSSTLAAINTQIQQHLQGVLTGWALENAPDTSAAQVTVHTLDGTGLLNGHAFLFNQVPSFLPPDVDPDTVTPILNFLASPLSGVIFGSLGPGIAPWIAMMNSIGEGDSFNEILASMWGGFLNGAILNLDSVLPAINDAGFLPVGMSLDSLDIAFGGLLSTGTVSVGPYQVLGEGGAVVAEVPAVGGSIFNAIGLQMVGVPVLNQIAVDAQAIGPIAAWQAWGQTVGALLGSGWDGKGAVVVTPPAVGVDLPILPDLDDGGMSADSTNFFAGIESLFDGLFG